MPRRRIPRWSPYAGDRLQHEIDSMPRVLIIAYGNPMRCDDGLAWHSAAALERKFSARTIEILRTHQLTPELAETVRPLRSRDFRGRSRCNGSPGEIRSTQIGLPHDRTSLLSPTFSRSRCRAGPPTLWRQPTRIFGHANGRNVSITANRSRPQSRPLSRLWWPGLKRSSNNSCLPDLPPGLESDRAATP